MAKPFDRLAMLDRSNVRTWKTVGTWNKSLLSRTQVTACFCLFLLVFFSRGDVAPSDISAWDFRYLGKKDADELSERKHRYTRDLLLTFFTNWQNLGDPRRARVIQISIEDCLFVVVSIFRFPRSRAPNATPILSALLFPRKREREREKLFLSHRRAILTSRCAQTQVKHGQVGRHRRERRFRSVDCRDLSNPRRIFGHSDTCDDQHSILISISLSRWYHTTETTSTDIRTLMIHFTRALFIRYSANAVRKRRNFDRSRPFRILPREKNTSRRETTSGSLSRPLEDGEKETDRVGKKETKFPPKYYSDPRSWLWAPTKTRRAHIRARYTLLSLSL